MDVRTSGLGAAESNTGMQEVRGTGDEVRDHAMTTQPLPWGQTHAHDWLGLSYALQDQVAHLTHTCEPLQLSYLLEGKHGCLSAVLLLGTLPQKDHCMSEASLGNRARPSLKPTDI